MRKKELHPMSKPRILTLVGMIFSAALIRLLPHPWNFTPVAAMALFGGAQFSDKRLAFAVPILALLSSDLILGFYPMWGFVYAAHALIVVIGILIRNNKSILSVGCASLGASVLFFLVSNLSHFFTAGFFPMTVAGLMQCYIEGLPFFRNTLMGDLFFSALLFGTFYAAEKRFSALREFTPQAA